MPTTPPTQRYTGKAVISDSHAGLVLEISPYAPYGHSITVISFVFMAVTVFSTVLALGWNNLQAGNIQAELSALPYILLFGVFCIIILRKIIWRLVGKEVVTLTPEGLSIWNKHLWFSGASRFSLNAIKGLRVGPPPDVDWRGLKYHPRYGPYARYGRIVFYANGRRVEFGEDIEADEGAYLVKLLQARLDAYAAAAAS